MMILIALIGLAAAALGSLFLQIGLRCLIAHRMIYQTIAAIRSQSWDLLVAYTSESSIRWRFFDRRYMRLIGLAAREKLSMPDAAKWRQKVDQDQILRLHAAGLDGKRDDELENYLITQYSNDVSMPTTLRALVIWLGGSVTLCAGIVISVYAIAQLW